MGKRPSPKPAASPSAGTRTPARGGAGPRPPCIMHQRPLQEAHPTMKVLVIGGTGFIGPKVVRHLVDMGHEVTLYNRGKSEAELQDCVSRIPGDSAHSSEHADEFRALSPDVALDMFALTESDA